MEHIITRAKNWYTANERRVSSFALVFGFTLDALTLNRVDLFWENAWVVMHLIIVASCIILINRNENDISDEENPEQAHFWYINALQFFFGGLLSTYLVLYFKSATLSATWPFILLLAGIFAGNEFFKRQHARLAFQIGLYFLSLFMFAVYILPVVFHKIGTGIFLLSGLASIGALLLFLKTLAYFTKEKFRANKKIIALSVVSIFLVINALYFLNLIPPIPLSLKESGVYHAIVARAPGNYLMEYEEKGWRGFFALRETFSSTPGSSAYAYSAIFSPASFAENIVHEWQVYDDGRSDWITASRVHLSIIGGREKGYRTYSLRKNIAEGKWRVNVMTAGGQIIGRLRFNVVRVNAQPELQTVIKN
jgi:hypothetical protein